MLWWVGSGLLLGWLVMMIFHPKGWMHLLLLAGVTVLVVQIAAHRKTKAARDIRG